MRKHITNSWNWGEPSVSIVKNRTSTSMVKLGAWYKIYKSNPDHTYVSALFLGSGEYYGCNNNGDFFEEDELIRCHPTFVDHAKHYKHHDNQNPENSYGEVCETYYNPDMHRVEGIIKIINKRSPDMIQKIMSGIPVPLSMACKVKYDVCSICGNKASNISLYCDDLKYKMGDILDDGRRVYAINPDPIFFDISEVYKGADSTAFTLKKVASSQEKDYNLVATKESTIGKQSILERLAEIEKKIEGMIDTQNPSIKILAKGIKRPIKARDMEGCKAETVIGALSKTGIALGPGRYNIFRYLSNNHRYLENNMPKESSIKHANILDKYLREKSLLSTYSQSRIEKSAYNLSEVKCTKKYNGMSRDVIKAAMLNLCSIYNNPSLLDDSTYTNMLVLQNMI